MIVQADAARLPLPNKCVDLVIGSPPYLEQRTYGIGATRKLVEWVHWMLDITDECLRVSRGLVLWVVAGSGGSDYQPGPEGLIWEGRKRFPTLRPCYWTANKPPSGAKWFSNELEYVVAFGDPAHFTAAPLGTPMKYSNGGAFRQRGKDGTRKAGSDYPTHTVRKTAPNVFRVPVGGGLMGHPLACENEAPYPVGVPERFVLSCCPPDGVVLDPFGGGGTTAQACVASGRRFISTDLRRSQCDLTAKRLASLEVAA